MTPDARVLRFTPRRGQAGGPAAEYGRFAGALSLDELAACFFFDDEDKRLIARRRTDASRLGFAVQLGTVRYLGRFLEDPAAVPAGVTHWTARELGVPAGTDLPATGVGSGAGPTKRRSVASTATGRSERLASRASWSCGCVPGRGSAPKAILCCSPARPSI